MKSKNDLITLVFPVYNERGRLRSGLTVLASYLRSQKRAYEVLLVDDGSVVPASEVVRGIADKISDMPLSIYRLSQNKGKGAAIAYGMKKAKGAYIIFCDIDFSVPPQAIEDIIEALAHSDIAIASRRLAHSEIVLHQPMIRELSGKIFTFLSNALFGLHLADTTCGCKGFRAPVGKELFGKIRVKRWVFDTEVLFLARKSGYSIAEVPVSWSHSQESRVRVWDSVGSFVDLLKIRWYWWRGRYSSS
jgi:dolichyl-phosphate beta-glucosyltransferase